jgi:hypothetical protein
MQPRSSASITKLLRNLSRVFAIVGLTTLVYACASEQLTPASTHATVSINVYPGSQQPSVPPSGACAMKNGYWICISEAPISLKDDIRPVTIPWHLATEGWTFTNKGIEITGGGWNEHQGATPSDYVARSNSKNYLFYYYRINVTNGSATVTWDPFIWNN